MRLFIIFAIFIAVLAGLSGCTKFEDGPVFSFYSTDSRITRTWNIKFITDLTVNETYYAGYEGWSFVVANSGNYTMTRLYKNEEFVETGTWKFEDDHLILSYKNDNSDFTKDYKILRLSRKDLWIVNDDEEIHYVAAE